jgi:hypothetical protein
MPSNNNWLALIVVVCFVFAVFLNQRPPLLRLIRRRPDRAPSILRRLDPVLVVVCLFAAQGAFGRPVTPAIGYLALVVFILSSPLLGRFDRPHSEPNGQSRFSRLPAACSRVLVRWGAILASLLFIAFAFNVFELFPRRVMLTWFVITPVALCISQAVRLRTR